MNKILVLWAVPRSTSTAFEWMMRMRGDFDCYHEPFGEAWYQGETPFWPRVQKDSVRTPGLTIESVWKTLRRAVLRGNVFIKDFPHYIAHMWDDAFLSHFSHSFLIRDPAKTIPSMYKHWPDFHPDEVGFKEQRALFELLTKLHGKPPPVIDSDDLLERPYQVVEAYCRAVGIPFLPDALMWKPGRRDEVSWWDGGSFHENLRNSDGLKPQKRRHIDIMDSPERVIEIYHQNLPHYQAMKKHRLAA